MVGIEGEGAKVFLPSYSWLKWFHLQPQPDETLLFVGNNTFKFLGLSIQVPHDPHVARTSIKQLLDRVLQAVDQSPVTRKQKLKSLQAWYLPQSDMAPHDPGILFDMA